MSQFWAFSLCPPCRAPPAWTHNNSLTGLPISLSLPGSVELFKIQLWLYLSLLTASFCFQHKDQSPSPAHWGCILPMLPPTPAACTGLFSPLILPRWSPVIGSLPRLFPCLRWYLGLYGTALCVSVSRHSSGKPFVTPLLKSHPLVHWKP